MIVYLLHCNVGFLADELSVKIIYLSIHRSLKKNLSTRPLDESVCVQMQASIENNDMITSQLLKIAWLTIVS